MSRHSEPDGSFFCLKMNKLNEGMAWKPLTMTKIKMESMNVKEAFKAFRDSSSGYIAKRNVRMAVLERRGSQCVNCGSNENIQIDHIMSVHFCFHNGMFEYCNSLDNLQPLCGNCNASKKP